jgi:hypothetical protein
MKASCSGHGTKPTIVTSHNNNYCNMSVATRKYSLTEKNVHDELYFSLSQSKTFVNIVVTYKMTALPLPKHHGIWREYLNKF